MTPFGKEVRKMRIDADITMSAMAQGLGKTPSYLSAVELGEKPLSEEFANAIVKYLANLTYFRKNPFDRNYLLRLADRSRHSVSVGALVAEDKEMVAAFARRLPKMPDARRAEVRRVLDDLLKE